MRKIKFNQKLSNNRSWKKCLGLICILGVCLASIVFLVSFFQEKKHVSAHPASTIELGSGDAKFTVPLDATQLEEQVLRDLGAQFDGYVQGSDTVPVLNKENVSAYGSERAASGADIGVKIQSIEETENGNYFVLFQIAGNAVGGITRTAVYDKEGNELASNSIGTRHNVYLRVGTKIYNRSNNTFLVTTFNNTWFRYTVNDTSSPVTIDRYQYPAGIVTGNPNDALEIDTHAIIDQFSDYSNDALIHGRSYPGHSVFKGIHRKRVSIGSMDTSGWETGGFNSGSTYQYTLESLLMYEELNLGETQGANISSVSGSDIYKSGNYIFGPIHYAGYQQGNRKIQETFQIFDTTVNVQERGDINSGMTNPILKKRVYQHRTIEQIRSDIANNNPHSYRVIKNMCDNEYIYFTVDNQIETQLIRVDLNTYTDEVIKAYPRATNINFFKNTDGTFSYYGTTTSLTGEFASNYYPANPTIGSHFFVNGTVEGITGSADDLDIRSLRAFEVDGSISADYALEGQDNKIFIGGITNDFDIFPNQTYTIDEGPQGIYLNPAGNPSSNCGFIGTLNINDDYAPIISSDKNILVDITDKAVTNPVATNYREWNTLDRWLITGSKNGTITDSSAIKVYDYFDSNDSSIAGTSAEREEWLQKRINRNPKDISASIQWKSLGFDASKTGPQLVTYFVTDTQNQPAATSRWVNSKTPQTEVEDEYMLDAQNFHIPLNRLNTSIPETSKVEKFKELAKTKAWNTEDHDENTGDQGYGLDEDGTDSNKISGKVGIDEDQLDVLRNAKVAKPYPVDVTYKPENGVSLTNRVWVFVTTTNTLPNNENDSPEDTNGMVFYADDYSIPFRLRGGHNAQNVRERGNVRVYDYFDTTHETDSTLDNGELPTLADSTKNPEDLNVRLINEIQGALSPGVVPQIVEYVWKENTDNHHTKDVAMTGHLNVTLTGDALLHVRQVVLDPSAELVIPQEGYVKIENRLLGQVDTEPTYQTNKIVNTQEQADSLSFTTFAVSVDHLANDEDEILLSLVVPENYHYVGQFVSHGISDPNGQSHDQGHQSLALGQAIIDKGTIISPLENSEFWITFYIKPNEDDAGNQKAIQPYSWDYKKNDLGKIKTK